MNTEQELIRLQQEVARLRREMDELRQFIHYHEPGEGDDGKPEAAYIGIRCAMFQLAHPADPNRSQINMFGSRDGGPFIALLDKDEKTRVLLQIDKGISEVSVFGKPGQYAASLQVRDGEPELDLYGKQGKVGVILKVAGEEERGQIGVCEAGKPRAVMQANDLGGGGISVVHDDGHPRVAITSAVDSGDLLMVTPDMQVGVKLSSNGQDGGFITVNRANGKPGVILSNIPTGGAVIIKDPLGQIMASLPSPDSLE
jgi:hypothetical protein